MWKYIIIGSITLFLGATYLFSKNHGAMVAPSGEIAAVQTQFDQAVSKQKNIALDKTIKAYAEYRAEIMKEQQTANENKKAEVEGKIETAKSEYASAEAEYQTVTSGLEAIRDEKANVFTKVAPVVDLDADSATEEEIGDAVKELMDKVVELERNNAEADARIAALGAESERLTSLIAAARKLAQDRQARLSPPELKCNVLTADRQWDYVILDAEGQQLGDARGYNLDVAEFVKWMDNGLALHK
jgi:chromosome segregation ATPase